MKVTVKKPTPVEPDVVVHMSMDEARNLRRVLFSVGGDPDGRRAHMKALGEELDRVGVCNFESIPMLGSLTFKG
jgi:hypothetical protein